MAVIAVGLLFIAQQKPQQQTVRTDTPNGVAASVATSSAPDEGQGETNSQENLTQTLQSIGTKPKEKEKPKTLKEVDARSIEGVWEAALNDGKAVIEIKGGTYRLITASEDPFSARRYFSSGRYDLRDKGLLVLEPAADAVPPQDDYTYSPIYNGQIPVVIGLRDELMVWVAPGVEVKIFVPTVHPFLRLAPEGAAVWKRL